MRLLSRILSREMFSVYTIPVSRDNYSYLVADPVSRIAAAVDPIEPSKIVAALTMHGLKLGMILTTHHHMDHCGGNSKLLSLIDENVPVYGGDDRVQAVSKVLLDPSRPLSSFKLGDSITITPISTPGHTSSHITYYLQSTHNGAANPAINPLNLPRPLEHHGLVRALFTGDTLFVAGCGRFFESMHDFSIMHESLYSKLCFSDSIPADTFVFCGHEYTRSNLKFALSMEPDNPLSTQMYEKIMQMHSAARKSHESEHCCTVPSTVGTERLINPFLRLNKLACLQGFTNEFDALGHLRQLKDTF